MLGTSGMAYSNFCFHFHCQLRQKERESHKSTGNGIVSKNKVRHRHSLSNTRINWNRFNRFKLVDCWRSLFLTWESIYISMRCVSHQMGPFFGFSVPRIFIISWEFHEAKSKLNVRVATHAKTFFCALFVYVLHVRMEDLYTHCST